MLEAREEAGGGRFLRLLRLVGAGLQLLSRPSAAVVVVAWMALIWHLSRSGTGSFFSSEFYCTYFTQEYFTSVIIFPFSVFYSLPSVATDYVSRAA